MTLIPGIPFPFNSWVIIAVKGCVATFGDWLYGSKDSRIGILCCAKTWEAEEIVELHRSPMPDLRRVDQHRTFARWIFVSCSFASYAPLAC